jgi:phosphoribosylamine--glycine ligase
LEGSKAFTKDFLARHNIPTAAYANFTEIEPALAYVREQGAPIVVKADGLAAGKGVIVAMTLEEAEEAIKDMLAGNAFGDAGSRVVVEEFLDGEEASFIVMVDGENVLPMATSQDHKRVGDQDTGPNTGGMGAPKVIEYNCRFGDPETQPIMMRMQSDLVELCLAAIDGKLDQMESKWDPRASIGIVLAAGGYPGDYAKGDVISGLPTTEVEGQKVFHAGTTDKDGHVVTNGGRVLCATALGNTVSEAQQRAYELAKQISWHGMFHRNDIGYRAIAREQENQ